MGLSLGKRKHLEALANAAGVIAAVAVDQRGSLRRAIARERSIETKDVSRDTMAEFKAAVTRVLTPEATAVLLDPEFGLQAARERSPNAGLLLAYERSGYDAAHPGRLPELLPCVSALRIAGWGADALNMQIYYSPEERPAHNDVKHALVERVGAECLGRDIPFFLQIVGYDPEGEDERGVEYARAKPEIVRRGMEEFSKPHYHVDVLKVEVPVNPEFVEGSRAFKGPRVYTHAEALEHYRRAAAATALPFIYVSAGVTNAMFVESLAMAAEAGVAFSGVLCGRAHWRGGVPIYARYGVKALEEWLADEGIRNVRAVNQAVSPATSLWAKLPRGGA